MATAEIKAPGGQAASDFIQERFGIQWGADVFGIAEDGFTASGLAGGEGTFELRLVGRCTHDDVQKFIALMWSKP